MVIERKGENQVYCVGQGSHSHVRTIARRISMRAGHDVVS